MIECGRKLNKIIKKLGYKFNDNTLLTLAITHSSHDKIVNNQRLEFLGDAILNFIIAEYLYTQATNADEGNLTRIRSSLVKKDTLASIARNYSIHECLILGAGELKTSGFNKDSILADSLEAIIAAIYLDSNLLTISKLIIDWYHNMGYLQLVNKAFYDKNFTSSCSFKDPKTILQELLHAKSLPVPIYEVFKVTGKPHKLSFVVTCAVEGMKEIIYGTGTSRKGAEQDAASKVLRLLQ